MAFRVTRIAALGAWGAVFWLAAAGGASAHPLGNFTINHLAEMGPQRGALRVHYVLDIAEIPTFQIMHAAGDGRRANSRLGERRGLRVADGLSIKANGARVPLHLERTTTGTRPGAGGFPTLYWTGDFTRSAPWKGAGIGP